MTFARARLLFALYALLLGALLVAGAAASLLLEVWWQQALAFFAPAALVFFAWIFGVVGFVGRVSPLLVREGLGKDALERWGKRWFAVSLAVLALVALGGVVQLFRVESWATRAGVFLGVGCGVQVGFMGVVFCFAALPQIQLPAPLPGDPPSEGARAEDA